MNISLKNVVSKSAPIGPKHFPCFKPLCNLHILITIKIYKALQAFVLESAYNVLKSTNAIIA